MTENSAYKLAVFDLDGTLTKEKSIWQYIHVRLGTWHGFAERYQERFLAGDISYEQFCELDAQVWKGMRVEELMKIVETVPFHPGTGELITYLKKKGLKLAVVSSGLSLLSDWVHRQHGFDFSVSNDLLHEGGVLTGKVRIKVHYDQKAAWLGKILDQFGLKSEQSIAIGDSLGDMDMFQLAGFSVAFNSSCQELDQIADVCIKNKSLAEIIPKLPL